MVDVDEQLARRFASVFEQHYGRVFDYAARRLGREHAEEVAAETFLIAWRRRDVLPGEPLPWLYGIARNVVSRDREAHARRQAVVRSLKLEHRPTASAEPEDAGLWTVWEQLSPRDREVLALVAWEELSVAEASGVIGCRPAVFSVWLHRARKRLERLLARSASSAQPVPNLSEAS